MSLVSFEKNRRRWTVAVGLLAATVVSACAPSAPAAPAPAPVTLPTVAIREAPLDWHLRDISDGVPGIGLLRAERELLAGRQPRRTVVVAVIDNGIDTAHTALRDKLWKNPDEQPGNGRDDDNNGFVDDAYGWSFLGGRDGKYVNQDTYEVTRLAAACGDSARKRTIPQPYRDRCPEIQAKFREKRTQAESILGQVRQIEAVMTQIVPILKRASGSDSLSVTKVEAITPANDTIRQARELYLRLAAAGLTEDEISDAKKAYTSQVQHGYNLSFDPRAIIGDDYPDTLVKRYGNADLTGPGAEHGTHVAGIVAASRAGGGTGIAPASARIMTLRAVPDGDERDKDVAAAIRYAVDNGAHVINMSFGKGYSPYKWQVDDAVRYADSKGVLMVHGAGNDGQDLAANESYPTPGYVSGGRARHWIEVGASSWKANDSLVATFSNYGKAQVDVFAPGVDIYSAKAGGGFKKSSGTSMASPVVAGVAALIMSYYPSLSALDVKRIILESATKLGERTVALPGEGERRARFGDLSVTGGIVNVYEAIRLAEKLTAATP